MIFELMDYQVLAVFLLGVCFASFFRMIIDEYQHYADKPRRIFLKHLWRLFSGYDDEPRIVVSKPHYIK